MNHLQEDDYCTLFPEYWQDIYIGDCCKIHDDTYSLSKFRNCLNNKGIENNWWIVYGGTIGLWVKYPIFMSKRSINKIKRRSNMWASISKILLQIVTSIISEKVLVEGAKLMITKAVDSKAEDIGVNDKDAREMIGTITSSTLNTLNDVMDDYLGI